MPRLTSALLCLALGLAPARADLVALATDRGEIVVELDRERAPATAANFLRYVEAGKYDGGRFHRTVRPDNQPGDKVKIAVVQAGIAPGEKEFAPVALERTSATKLKHLDGTISMARDGPDTATGDFFLCVGDQPALDFGGKRNPDGQGFAAFGRVVRGMDVVRAVNAAKADGQALKPAVRILSARRLLPRLVAHRGLAREAPENTLAAFGACLPLRLGFELDVRRGKDGTLVVLHDDHVGRTTDGKGKLDSFALAELQKLDAGRWFSPDFAGQRVPTLAEVFALVARLGRADTLVAVDLKVEDVEADVVRLANEQGVLSKLAFIGTAIDSPAVRRRLRAADAKASAAALAQTGDDLGKALEAKDADWAYLRFVPSPEQARRARAAGKKILVVGKAVAGREPDNWDAARRAGVDAILTDHPLDCRRHWRGEK